MEGEQGNNLRRRRTKISWIKTRILEGREEACGAPKLSLHSHSNININKKVCGKEGEREVKNEGERQAK